MFRDSRHQRAETTRGRSLPRGRSLLAGSLTAAVLGLCAQGAIAAPPNDPSFSLQWGDGNTGQLIPTQESEEVLGPEAAGTPGADDRALEAWGVTTGSRSIVVGVVDTGVDYADPDLAANVWSNPGGVGGCPSGTPGFNVLEPLHKCEPLDEELGGPSGYDGHGTHVAGIIGAVGDNGVGVAGMNWRTSILPVKWLSSANGANSTENLIEALEAIVAAKQAGVNIRVVNDSPTFAGTEPSPALSNEIDALGANNILFVTAAGNTGNNDDVEKVRRYPCGYDRPTEICVTASDDNDLLPSWANYGPHTVDLAAPGVSIYSTLRGGALGYLSGGSMAAAQVSGAAALILSAEPSLTVTQLKQDILDNVDPLPSLAGKVRTGGRLDVARALPGAVASVTPDSGPSSGGTSVTITGANLSHVTAVQFGASSAASYTIDSPSRITATSPAGGGTVDVTVTTPAGTSALVPGDRFTGEEPPATPPGSPSPSPGPSPSTAGQPTAGQPAVGQSAVLGTASVASTIALATTTLTVHRGRATVELRCVGSHACSATLKLAVELVTRRPGRRATARLQTIGSAAFSLQAGQSKSVAVALGDTGRTLLSAAHGRLNALLTLPSAMPGPSRPVTKAVRLRTH